MGLGLLFEYSRDSGQMLDNVVKQENLDFVWFSLVILINYFLQLLPNYFDIFNFLVDLT